MKQAYLVNLRDEASREIVESFENFTELNGNPYYHKWRWNDKYSSSQKDYDVVNNWLLSIGLTEKDIAIITGGW